MTGRLGIDDVTPTVGDGHHPSKAVVGEVVPIGATVWREGHDAIAANVVWKKVGSDGPGQHVRMAPTRDDVDRFTATVVPDEPGLWTFRVDAWSDPWATWRHAVTVKLNAGQGPDELANDLEVGARLLQRVGRRPAERANRDLLFAAANALRDTSLPVQDRVAPALFPAVHTIMVERPVRELITRGQPRQVYVDRSRALFGSWYEFFPRSTGGRDENGKPGPRHVHHLRQGARPHRRDGLRRGLPAPDPPDRHGAPQGPEQRRAARRQPRRAARRRRLAVGHRVGRGWPRRDRPARWATSTTSTPSSPAPATSAWRSRSTSRCRPRRTTRGSPPTPSGSRCARTARSPTRRTRPRSTRTSTRSTSTTTPRASTPSRCAA